MTNDTSFRSAVTKRVAAATAAFVLLLTGCAAEQPIAKSEDPADFLSRATTTAEIVTTSTTAAPTTTEAPAPPPPDPAPVRAPAQQDCDPSYPDFCIPPPPPDLDCGDVSGKRFTLRQPDPHGFDRDQDGVGCES